MAEAPIIFYENPQVIYDRMIARYSVLVERPILPQQSEALVFRTILDELVRVKASGDIGVSQMLAQFSSEPMIDYLAGNSGTSRLPATPAETTLVFYLLAGHGTVTIQAGTRVRSQDGLMVFATDQEITAAPGVASVQVTATALLDGPQGNAYAPGFISDLIDPKPFVTQVANSEVTAGGADIETTERLRQRILIAQNQQTTAGSVASYKYWALSANPSIVDVEVVSPKDSEGNSLGGQVRIYPLVSGGETTPQAILNAVEAATSGEDRRPINDKVIALSPTKVPYTVNVHLILKSGAIQSVEEGKMLVALSLYAQKRSKKLGADVTGSQIIAAVMNDNIHSVILPQFEDLIIAKNEFAVLSQINIVPTTYENEDA